MEDISSRDMRRENCKVPKATVLDYLEEIRRLTKNVNTSLKLLGLAVNSRRLSNATEESMVYFMAVNQAITIALISERVLIYTTAGYLVETFAKETYEVAGAI